MPSMIAARLMTIGPAGLYWELPTQRMFTVEPQVGDGVEMFRSISWEIIRRHHRRDGALMLELDCIGADETTLRGLEFQPAPRPATDS